MSYSFIRFRKSKHAAWITLDRPNDGNIIDLTMGQEFADACHRANIDEDVRVVIVTGAGHTFCAGNISMLAGKNSGRDQDINKGCGVAGSVAGMEKPVIAAINGNATGQGLELALACDVRVASSAARFCLPDINFGRIPIDGGTQRLPRLVGSAKAMELIFTGNTIDAEEAKEIGLVSRVVPAESLLSEVRALAESISEKAPIALRYIKEAINGGLDLTLDQGLRLEADLYYLIHTTTDRTEGIQAFKEKRRPLFKGQ